jgi:hypothetical protein
MYRGFLQTISHFLHHGLHCGNACYAFVFDGKAGHTVGEVDGSMWITVAMEVDEEGGGEDITCPRGVYLAGGIRGKVARGTVLEEGCAVLSIGGDQQGNLETPAGQNGIGFGAVAVSERQEVIVAKNEDVEQGEHMFGADPRGRPDAAIFIPATQPALGCGGNDCAWTTREEREQLRSQFLVEGGEQYNGSTAPGNGNIFSV